MFKVEFSKLAIKNLEKLDQFTKRMILDWIDKNLEGCENPRVFGKALTANRKDQWRYRVGDYRIITKIEDDKLVILVITIGHRREIYDK